MADSFKVIPRDQVLRARAETMEHGYIYPLQTTSLQVGEDIEANIRRISLMDKAILEVLPLDIQKVVWDGLQEYQREVKKARAAGDPQSLAEMVKNNSQVLKAADAWCIASFIAPKLVRTVEELETSPGAWLLEDVAEEDRVAVMQACTDSSTDAAQLLKKFRPQSKANAGDNVSVSISEHVAEPVLED